MIPGFSLKRMGGTFPNYAEQIPVQQTTSQN